MNKKFSKNDIVSAHKYCTANFNMLSKDSLCGCFYCLEVFSPRNINFWINDKDGKTAVCPKCGIDSVISESSGYPLTKEFLSEMHKYWF